MSSIPDLDLIRSQLMAVHSNIGRVILGKDETIERLLWAIVASGHVLFRDVPGVGKTLMARAFAASIGCEFRRVQFTPDLLPMDVTGTNVFNLRTKSFEFQAGPVFTNVLLGDEINRAPPKTQSALLEAMEERQVTLEGTTHPLPQPFIALATMNPLEEAGTYPLPAAQLDRFMMMLSIGIPSRDAEQDMLDVHLSPTPVIAELAPVVTASDIVRWQRTAPLVFLAPELRAYVVDLVRAIRSHSRNLRSVSPRSTLLLARAAQARALFQGRSHVGVDDVRDVAPVVLGHRVLLADSGVGQAFVRECVHDVPAPA